MKKKKIIILIAVILILVAAIFVFKFILKIIKPLGDDENNQLVGGCGGVYYVYWNECCDNWAKENNIPAIKCPGSWIVENNTCKYLCRTGDNSFESRFCGTSTNALCNSDSNCKIGGCSNQVCEGKNENTATTCEFKDCYIYQIGLSCGCVNNICKWH